jgi:hypothetical protein
MYFMLPGLLLLLLLLDGAEVACCRLDTWTKPQGKGQRTKEQVEVCTGGAGAQQNMLCAGHDWHANDTCALEA